MPPVAALAQRHPSTRDVIDSRQIDKSSFSLCQLNRIEWLGIKSK